MKCEYIYKNRETDFFCNHLKKYGNYCFKHRSNYLLCENKSINFKRFTYESKDYWFEALANGWIKCAISAGILYFVYDAWALRDKSDK